MRLTFGCQGGHIDDDGGDGGDTDDTGDGGDGDTGDDKLCPGTTSGGRSCARS